MTETNKTDPTSIDQPAAEGAASDPAMAPAGGEETLDLGSAAELMQRLEAEKADLTDRLLRAHADMQNLRRRTEKDVADARIYAVTKFARDMLDVCDNLRRALEAIPADERAQADASFKALIEGVELTERDMLKKLDLHGVKRLSPEGEKFDPNFHQAMFEADDPSKPNGTVITVLQVGYMLADRVLRPALVGVSRGGPKAAPANCEGEPTNQ